MTTGSGEPPFPQGLGCPHGHRAPRTAMRWGWHCAAAQTSKSHSIKSTSPHQIHLHQGRGQESLGILASQAKIKFSSLAATMQGSLRTSVALGHQLPAL